MHKFIILLLVGSISFASASDKTPEEWSLKFDKKNLKNDKNKTRTDWRSRLPVRTEKTHHITCKRKYYGLVNRPYSYDVLEVPELNELVAHVKIHYYTSKTYLRRMEKFHVENHPDKKYYPLEKDLMKDLKARMVKVQELWNSQAPEGLGFLFDIVDSPQEAHYSVKLTAMFGAMYDKFLWSHAGPDIIAHEMGHMLGLDEEYSPITSNVAPINQWLKTVLNKNETFDQTTVKDMRCNLDSLMCLRENLYPYHFEHVFGRIP